MTPIKVPAPKKGRRCHRCPRRRLGYGGCWGLLRPEWLSNVSRALYGPESLKEASPVPVQKRDSRPTAPFPLQDHEGQLQALQALYEEAGEHKLASEITALRGLQVSHPEMGADELQRLNNQVLLMIAEYHLTSASQGTHSIQPVLPEGAARLMPPVDEYLPGSFEGCHDVRVTDRAQILRIATWLHHLDLAATYSVEIANSPQVEDYDFGPLLEYFLMPRLSTITLQEVAARVAQENRRDLEASLSDLHEERDSLQNGIELLTTALENEQQRERRKAIKKQLDSWRRELHSNLRRISRLEGSWASSNLSNLPRLRVPST